MPAWYSDIVSAGKQAASDVKTGVQSTASKAASSAIQSATQSTLKKIGVKPEAPAAPSQAPTVVRTPVSIPAPVSMPAQVKKAGLPIALVAVAGVAFWYFFLRKK